MNTLGIYIHIPFCLQKCLYCDFLSFPKGRAQQALYFDAMRREIFSASSQCEGYEVVSVFFGGGTPTSVEPSYIADIMDLLKRHYNVNKDAEVTIECNPGTADYEALKLYRESGINRISIGLQSANDEELKSLGRIHNLAMFEKCYESARKAGFDNVNVDLMSALPGQSLADWEKNLNYVCALDPSPEHISAYSLIIEEGTPFFDLYGGEDDDYKKGDYAKEIADSDSGKENKSGIKPLPDEDTEREMYHRTKEILKSSGYHRYEISNYAKNPGNLDDKPASYECLHNKRYWQGGDYIGFGLGAASLMKGERFHNTTDFKKYLEAFSSDDSVLNVHEDIEVLDRDSSMEEFMFLGLRMVSGVSASKFRKRFNRDIETVYGKIIDELICDGLMMREGDVLRLSDKGLDVSNYCMAKFLIS